MKSGEEELELIHTFDLVLRIYLVAFVLAVIVGTVLIAHSYTEENEIQRSGIQFNKHRIVLEAEDVP